MVKATSFRDLERAQSGLSGRDIAAILNVFAQRVSQLLKSAGRTHVIPIGRWRWPDGTLGSMAYLRVDASPLLAPLRSELLSLLAGLSGTEWVTQTACPGWSVHAVASHLLGVELGNVSVRRDGWALAPAAGEDPDAWLNGFNQL